jgi:selenocysteine-specific elongation factor
VTATKSIVIGTAGHIDHGKSALVRALTGTDPDRLKEERERGITIDLGFAHCEIDGVNFAFVDVPGHERFVRNMLAGAGGIDSIVLVVAADESVMPQTREHFQICRLLRVSSGIIALTKADLVDADMLALVRDEVAELAAGTFLEGAPIVPVSSRTGAGLGELRAALTALVPRVPARPVDGAVRLPIDRVFSKKGFGPVVTGTLVSGRLALEQDLEVLPGGQRVKVRGIQVHGAGQQKAVAGNRTAVNVSGAELGDLHRGQSLVEPGAFGETRVCDAVVQLLPDSAGLKHGARVHVHQGTAERLGRVTVAGPGGEQRGTKNVERTTKNDERRNRNEERGTRHETAVDVAPGARAYIRLRLEAPAVLVRGDRFILRAYSPTTTIGGGVVLDPQPPRARIRTAAALERLRAIDLEAPTASPLAAILRMVAEAGAIGMPTIDVTRRVGVAPTARASLVASATADGRLVSIGDRLLDPAVVERLQQQAIALVEAFHAAHPLSDGMPREELRHRLLPRSEPGIFDELVRRLTAAGRLAGTERIRVASHAIALTPEEQAAYAAIEAAYRDAGLTPPDTAAVAARAGAPALVERMTALLTRHKQLVRLDTMVFHRDVLERLKDEVRALKAAGTPKVDVAAFKERFGVSRKFAIPLLEYLDRERVTRRMGDARVIL